MRYKGSSKQKGVGMKKDIILLIEDDSNGLPVIDLSKHEKRDELMDSMVNKTRNPALKKEIEISTKRLICAGVLSKRGGLRVIRFYKPRKISTA